MTIQQGFRKEEAERQRSKKARRQRSKMAAKKTGKDSTKAESQLEGSLGQSERGAKKGQRKEGRGSNKHGGRIKTHRSRWKRITANNGEVKASELHGKERRRNECDVKEERGREKTTRQRTLAN